MCVCTHDGCSGWMLAQHWKPQDGGDLMLGLHFSVFPRKRKPASHNARFVVSCAVMSLFSCFSFFFSFFALSVLHCSWKNGKEMKVSVAFQQKNGLGTKGHVAGSLEQAEVGWKYLEIAGEMTT